MSENKISNHEHKNKQKSHRNIWLQFIPKCTMSSNRTRILFEYFEDVVRIFSIEFFSFMWNAITLQGMLVKRALRPNKTDLDDLYFEICCHSVHDVAYRITVHFYAVVIYSKVHGISSFQVEHKFCLNILKIL